VESIDSRPTGLNIAPVLHVNLVHGGKVIHVGQEHIDLDSIIEACASSLQYDSKVLYDIMLFAMSAYLVPTFLE
jgi:hypothetical protein